MVKSFLMTWNKLKILQQLLKKQSACLTSCGSTQRLSPFKSHHCLYSLSDLWTTQCTIASLTFLLWGNPWEARTKNERWLIATVEIIGLLNWLCFWIVWAQRDLGILRGGFSLAAEAWYVVKTFLLSRSRFMLVHLDSDRVGAFIRHWRPQKPCSLAEIYCS